MTDLKTEKAVKRVITRTKSDHKTKRIYNCTYEGCDKVFSSSGSLYRHEDVIHFKLDAIYCEYPDCGYKTYNQMYLDEHITKHDNYAELSSQTIVCHYEGCDEVFTDKKSWIKHRNGIHRYLWKERCTHPGCGYMTVSKTNLKAHMTKHSKDRPFVCTMEGCGKRFKHEGTFKGHLKIHEDKFKCSFDGCDKTFESRPGLSTHMKSVHIRDRLYSCEWPGCEYETYSKSSHTIHQNVHGLHKYVCDYTNCNAKYKDNDTLKSHRFKKHGIGQGFECSWPGCDYKSVYKYKIKYHERIHTNERNYACTWPGCQYRCVCSSNLKGHMKIHQK